jgi:hypothetical protein
VIVTSPSTIPDKRGSTTCKSPLVIEKALIISFSLPLSGQRVQVEEPKLPELGKIKVAKDGENVKNYVGSKISPVDWFGR